MRTFFLTLSATILTCASLTVIPVITNAAVAPLDSMYQWLDPVGRVYNQGNLLETENTQQELIRRVASVIRAALTLLGIIFVVLIVYAGARWMTARGNEDLVQTARDTLQNAGIGLVIIIASYALTATIISLLLRETTS
ncbi:MAG: hypothetical protein WC052_00015 [Patescibacteria group bacterium]